MRTIPWECELLTVHFSIVLGIGKARAARNLHYRTRNLYYSEILLKCVVPGSCNPAGCVYHSYGLAPPTTVIQKLSNPPSPRSLVFRAAASRGFHLTSSNLPFTFSVIFFPIWNSENESEVAQSCLTLCNPVDSSPLGSCIHGILQARILEWVAISLSRGIFLTQGSHPDLPHCGQML